MRLCYTCAQMAGGAGTIGPVGREATRIRALRLKRHLTPAALAKESGVSREYLMRLEAGRYDPRLSVLERIAKALRVPLTALVK